MCSYNGTLGNEIVLSFACGLLFTPVGMFYSAGNRRSMIPELFNILLPRITPKVLEVVNRHLTDEQIGLLLVKLINPYIVISQEEEATLRGVNRKTLRGMKARGEVSSSRSSNLGVNLEEAPIFPKSGAKSPKKGQSFQITPKSL